MKRILLSLLIFTSTPCWATDYFVKTGGNDGLAGTTDATAWATITKINAQSFSPDDNVYFNCGDTWNMIDDAVLSVPMSGSDGNPITFSSYGTGSKPLFTSGLILTSAAYKWTPSLNGTNEYYCELAAGGDPTLGYEVTLLILSGNIQDSATAGSLLDHEWDDADNDTLGYNTVYLRDDTGDPDTSGVSILVEREYGITVDGKGYIVLDGLAAQYCQDAVYLTGAVNNVMITNCDLSFSSHAIYCAGTATGPITITNNNCLDISAEGLYISGSIDGSVISGNVFNRISKGHTEGDGIDIRSGTGAVTISNNSISNTQARGIVITRDGCIIEDNVLENIRLESIAVTPSAKSGETIIRRNLIHNVPAGYRGIVANGSVHSIDFIINSNLIYDSPGGLLIRSTCGQVDIYNNTIVVSEIGVFLYSSLNVSQLNLKNNILHSRSCGLMEHASATVTAADIDYNFYAGDCVAANHEVYWDSNYYTVANFYTAKGYEEHGLSGDPLFFDQTNFDFRLKKGSPCPFAGTEIPGYDICGRKMPQKHGQCMGAIQPKISTIPLDDAIIHGWKAGCKP